MALGTPQKVIADVGSDELTLTRLQLNAALTFIDLIIDTAIATADGNAFRVAMAALDPSTTLNTIVATKVLPPARRFPTP